MFDDLLNLINAKGGGAPTMILNKLNEIKNELTSELYDLTSDKMQYFGTHNASGGSYPTTPTGTGYYIISVAGTIDSNPLSVGDLIIYNGLSWNCVNPIGRLSAVILDDVYSNDSWEADSTHVPTRKAIHDYILLNSPSFFANDVEDIKIGGDWGKTKEIKALVDLTDVKVTFQLRSHSAVREARARISLNGAIQGSEKATYSTSWKTYSETIAVVNTDDLIQIYSRSANSEYHTHIRNMRLTLETMPKFSNQNP
ncbi:hypothetical protein ES705_26943 [subsurface metagenome]